MDSAYGSLNAMIRGASTDIHFASAAAVRGGTRGSMNLVRVLSEALEKRIGDPSDLQKIHSNVAAGMRQSVKSSFEQSVKSYTGTYRVGQNRISGGALKRAITSDSLAVGTPTGIDFIDQGRLDTEAAHWRRLNYGAFGTRVKDRQVTKRPFKFDNVILYTIGLTDSPRPAFGMPPGRFTTTEGKRISYEPSRRGLDKFSPGGGGRRPIPVTGGIRARNFLDAGIVRLTTDLPPAYTRLVKSWLNDAGKSGSLKNTSVRIRAGVHDRQGRFTSIAP